MENDNKNIENKILLQNDKLILKRDCDGKILIEKTSKLENNNLAKISEIISKLNNVEMSKNQREKYVDNIKDVCCVIDFGEDFVSKNIRNLECNIEQSLKLRKKLLYISTTVFLFLVLIVISLCILKQHKNISYIFICSSLGGILGTLYRQDTLDINYNVADYVIFLEGIKRVIVTVVVGVVGFIAIKADIVLPNFYIIGNEYTLALVIIICGYSTNFIPNILDKMILVDKEEDKEN